jgi:glycosyltransferase involved in cell wall biosynthesis
VSPVVRSPGPIAGLRVAHVVATGAFAGSERYALNLAAGLAELGAEVVLVGGDAKLVPAALAETAAPVRYLPAEGTLAAYRSLRTAGPFDIVHCHLTPAEVAATAAFPTRSRTVIVCTRHIACRRGSSRGARLASAWVRTRLDGQVAISQYVAGKIDGPSRVIPTGVPDQSAGAHDEPTVVVAQRLEAEKDTTTALRAWSNSGLAAKGWQLHVLGSGSQEAFLRTVAVDLGITQSCHFFGQVTDTQDRFRRAGVLIASATAEPFGLSVVEAMAVGLPVVASAAGGHLETVGPLAKAVMFPPGDHLAAADHLRYLAEDATFRAAYGRDLRARQHAKYSFANFLRAVVEWYQVVLQER